jgi:integrase
VQGSIRKVDRPQPWWARYRAPDGRQRSKSFKTKGEAERWLRQNLKAIDNQEWLDPGGGRVTLAEWWPCFLDSLPPDRAPRTFDRYASIWRVHVGPAFGASQLARITAEDVQRWTNDLGVTRSPDMVRQARQLLFAMLDLAVKRRYLSHNPVVLVKAPRPVPRRQLILDTKEVERLATSADDIRPGSGVLIRFLASTGLRFGEVVALRVSDVDLNTGAVIVQRSATEGGRGLIEGPTKSRKTRTVYFGPRLAIHLRPLIESREPDDRVFTAPRGGPLRYNAYRRAVWDRARQALPEAKRDVTPHDLRDAYAVAAIRSGADLLEVSRALGHSSAAVTANHYADHFDAARARIRAVALEEASNVVALQRS